MPLVSEEAAPVLHCTLTELETSDLIDAALIDMYLPPGIDRASVRLARQSIVDWKRGDGETRPVSPPVILWGLFGRDVQGIAYRGALIGIEGAADITPVTRGVNVLGLVNRAVGGGGIATDQLAFDLWRRSEAFLENGVWLIRTIGDDLDGLQQSLADWIHDEQRKNPNFDTSALHLGERSMQHVETTALYCVQPEGGAFKMEQVGPVVQAVSDSYAALRLGSLKHPWRGQRGQGVSLTLNGTRLLRLKEASEKPLFDPVYKLPTLVGDFDEIVADAQADYSRRRTTEAWRQFLPPPDRPEDIAEARIFVDFLNKELLDLQLPESCVVPLVDGMSQDVLPYTARIRELPFWDCYELVELTERVGGRRRRTSLLWAKNPDLLPTSEATRMDDPAVAEELERLGNGVRRIVGLDGKSNFIHYTNRAQQLLERLRLDDTTLRSYAEFFCAYVHGEGGSFSILEQADDVDWLGFHHRQRDIIGPRVFPMRLWPARRAEGAAPDDIEQGPFIEAFVTYGGGLFRAVFQIMPDGTIGMKEDHPLLDDLDIRTYSWTPKHNWLLATFPEVE